MEGKGSRSSKGQKKDPGGELGLVEDGMKMENHEKGRNTGSQREEKESSRN